MSEPIRQPPRAVGGRVRTQGAQRTGWTMSIAPAALDDLTDVDAPRGLEGLLQRGPDGMVRPIPTGDVRTDWFGGNGPPPDVVPGASRGDLYVDRLTGDLYRLE